LGDRSDCSPQTREKAGRTGRLRRPVFHPIPVQQAGTGPRAHAERLSVPPRKHARRIFGF